LESGAEMMDGSAYLENDQPQGKEAAENIETKDEISKKIHRNGG
jgi:hypothetical protein